MNSVTPENIGMIVQGATPVQIITMVFLGIISLGVVIGIVKWVIDLKLASMPDDIKSVKECMQKMQLKLIEVEGKLWTHDDIKREIQLSILNHENKYHGIQNHN